MRLLVLFFLQISLLSVNSFGQRNCGSLEYQKKYAQHQTYSTSKSPITDNITARDTLSDETINIPVVIHVLYNLNEQNISDAQILSQINILNEDYNRLNADASNTPSAFQKNAGNCKIHFCVAKVDPQGRQTKGIIRKYTSKVCFSMNDNMKFANAGGDDAWDSKRYLNIWVCNLQSNVLGYSSLPNDRAELDGVVIQYNAFGNIGTLRPQFNKGRTATHEIGHWMGLLHIWGDNTCGNDYVDDTPPQTYYNGNCPSFPHKSQCSINNNGDMFMNFMDYTNDECMNLFTNGQKNKMRKLFALNGPRNSFLLSNVCDSSNANNIAIPSSNEAINKPVQSVTIFPNPSSSIINMIPVNGYDLNNNTVHILDATGKILINQKVFSSNKSINISSLKSGVYFLKIGSGTDQKMIKLIKN